MRETMMANRSQEELSRMTLDRQTVTRTMNPLAAGVVLYGKERTCSTRKKKKNRTIHQSMVELLRLVVSCFDFDSLGLVKLLLK